MSAIDKREFLKEYSRNLREGSAALFVGAGMSVSAGFVDWRGLLKEIAEELNLDVDRESDLVALAQYHVNHHQGRDKINQLLIDHFIDNTSSTPNHALMASLPIESVWTTNYDDLLEKAFEAEGKRVDIKRRQTDFATTRRNSDTTIYKMHGDKTDAAEAILTKDDYELYDKNREAFTIALKGDLVRRTFLFLGFGFTDPNVGYILSRVKHLLEDNARQHYCLMKKPVSGSCGDDAYSCAQFSHRLADLRRYKIQPVLIDDYGEITSILQDLNRRSHLLDVFISGSAADFNPYGKDKLEELCRSLARDLIAKHFNVVSGFGVGIGDSVIVGATQALTRNDDHRLKLWPFPQQIPTGQDRAAFWRGYRERMISNAGTCVVIAGNKMESGAIVPANGVREEVEIARKQGKYVIPIGATGHVAEEIWKLANADLGGFFNGVDVSAPFATIGDKNACVAEVVKAVIEILKALDK